MGHSWYWPKTLRNRGTTAVDFKGLFDSLIEVAENYSFRSVRHSPNGQSGFCLKNAVPSNRPIFRRIVAIYLPHPGGQRPYTTRWEELPVVRQWGECPSANLLDGVWCIIVQSDRTDSVWAILADNDGLRPPQTSPNLTLLVNSELPGKAVLCDVQGSERPSTRLWRNSTSGCWRLAAAT
jgi:hypothetical protein